MAGRDGITFFNSLGVETLFVQGSAGTNTAGTSGQFLTSGGANGAVSWSTAATVSVTVASSAAQGIVSTGTQSLAGRKTFVSGFGFGQSSDTSAPISVGYGSFRLNTTASLAGTTRELLSIEGISGSNNSHVSAYVRANINLNSAITASQIGLYSFLYRQITSNTTDSTAVDRAAGNFRLGFNAPGATYTNSDQIAALQVDSTVITAGTVALTSEVKLYIKADSATTGTRKTGIRLGTQSGNTSNAQIADNITYSGHWIANFTSTSPSRLGGPLGLAADNSSQALLTLGNPSVAFPVTSAAQIGAYAPFKATAAATNRVVGFESVVTTADGVQTTGARLGVYVVNIAKGTSSTITRDVAYGVTAPNQGTNNALFSDDFTFTGDWGIYLASTRKNRLGGILELGTTASTQSVLYVTNSSILAGTEQRGLHTGIVSSSAATNETTGYYSEVTTANSAFTTALRAQFYAANPSKGAASTITRDVAYFITTPNDGANNASIADNTGFSGSYFINSTNTSASLISGILNASAGVRTKVSVANVSNPPTNAELVSAFGAAATVGAGFIGIVNDNDAETNEWIVWSDGTSYWYIAGTAAA